MTPMLELSPLSPLRRPGQADQGHLDQSARRLRLATARRQHGGRRPAPAACPVGTATGATSIAQRPPAAPPRALSSRKANCLIAGAGLRPAVRRPWCPGDQRGAGRRDLAREQLQRRLLRMHHGHPQHSFAHVGGARVRAEIALLGAQHLDAACGCSRPAPCARTARACAPGWPRRCACALRAASMPTMVSWALQRKPSM